MDGEIHGLTPVLQLIGYNALSVGELFGGNTRTTDPQILNVARQVQGLVVTYDKSKDLGGGFAERALRLNPRLPKTIESVIRQIDAVVPPTIQ